MIIKFVIYDYKVCVCPPTDQVWVVITLPMLPDALLVCDSMSGKCVAGCSVAVAGSSSRSFLLMVDEVIENCHSPDHVTTRTSFALSPS